MGAGYARGSGRARSRIPRDRDRTARLPSEATILPRDPRRGYSAAGAFAALAFLRASISAWAFFRFACTVANCFPVSLT